MKKRVELTFKAEKLVNVVLDPLFGGKSSPILHIYLKEDRDFGKFGETETVRNNLNPEWKASFRITHFVEKVQMFKFVVCDSGWDQKPLGEHTCELSSICGSTNMSHTVTLKRKVRGSDDEWKASGLLTIVAEEVPGGFEMCDNFDTLSPEEKLVEIQKVSMDQFFEQQTYVTYQIAGVKLKKMDTFGKSDPYYHLYKRVGQDGWKQIDKSEMIKETLNPLWSGKKMLFHDFCSGSVQKLMKIEVFDWNSMSSDQLIGICEFKVQDIVDKPDQLLELLLPPKKKKKKVKKKKKKKVKKMRGHVQFKSQFMIRSEEGYNQEKIKMWGEERKKLIDEVERRRAISEQGKYFPPFLNLLNKYEISMMVGIDFGAQVAYKPVHPCDPQSIHYLSPDNIQKNEIQMALKDVSDIILEYDKDKSIPFFGICGIPNTRKGEVANPHNYSSKNCFPMNGNRFNPNVRDIGGLLTTYEKTVANLSIGKDPKTLSSFLNKVKEIVYDSVRVNPFKYYVVVIIMCSDHTDNVYSNINNLSNLPVSIVMIGVGESRFVRLMCMDEQNEGSGDNRDVVQFVPYRNYRGTPEFAAQVLREIPQHVVEYERNKNGRKFTEDEVRLIVRTETQALTEKVTVLELKLEKVNVLEQKLEAMEKLLMEK